jgi:hypothetical protein
VRQLEWPDELRDRSVVAEGLAMTGVLDATSLFFEFDDAQLENLVKALEAPVCEFVGIHSSILLLSSSSFTSHIRSRPVRKLHSTFTNKHGRHAYD